MNTNFRWRGRSLAVPLAVSLGVALAAMVLAKETAGSPKLSVSDRPINREAKAGVSFAPVIRKVVPSVVNIFSSRTVRLQRFQHPFLDDPFLRRFFGDESGPNSDEGRPRLQKAESLGSGVIVTPDGYILTANHVVDGAEEVKVAIGDSKKEFVAKVIGTDPPTDVAVLKIDGTDLPAVTLADSDKLEVGDVVLAIGNPFGVGRTVTMGIVSALGRGGFEINGYEDFIQTDAAINPGNSGGALVDAEGRLIGINTAIISRTGGFQGVGFAVPINMAQHVMERLIKGGKVARGYLGVLPQDLTPGLARRFGVPDQSGALIGNVYPGTPAEKAGLKAGDVIVEINGKKVADRRNLQLLVSQSSPGSKATVRLVRKGQEKVLTVVLGELPEEAQDLNGRNGLDGDKPSTTDALDGVTVDNLDPEARRQLDIPADVHGVVVTDVATDSNAAEAGLQNGDVLVEINEQPVRNADQAVDLCNKAKGDEILLQVWRRTGRLGGTLYISVNNTKKK